MTQGIYTGHSTDEVVSKVSPICHGIVIRWSLVEHLPGQDLIFTPLDPHKSNGILQTSRLVNCETNSGSIDIPILV